MLKTPIFITNFKTYEQAVGLKAIELAKIHEKVAIDTGKSIGVAVAAADIYRVSQAVNIPVFAQHVDPVDYGSFTGHILPQNIRNAGAIGTLLNHSERRVDPEILSQSTTCAQKASLVRVMCAENPDEVESLAALDPDFLAFEPPELIGSSDKSVSSEAPDSIRESVERSLGIPVLVGAGINSPEDIRVAMELGANGFLVASAIVKAADPEAALTELVKAM